MQNRFTTSPVDFSRFVALTRSSSRSLSPENELKQMMLRRGGGLPLPVSARQAGERVAASSERSAPPALVTGEEQGLPGSSARLALTEGTLTDVLRQAGEAASSVVVSSSSSSTSLQLKGSRARHGEAIPHGERGTAPAGRDAASNEAEEIYAAAALWQYGSPMYSPVTSDFYCWNYHRLRPKPRNEYGDVEGVSCDFCGFTHWANEQDGGEESAPKATSTSSRGRGGGRGGTTRGRRKGPTYNEESVHLFFYHCDICGVDVCARCLDDVKRDVRYHVPCTQCQRCGTYVALEDADEHRCRGVASAAAPAVRTASTAAAASGYRLTMGSLLDEEPEMDLLRPSRETPRSKTEASPHTPVLVKAEYTDVDDDAEEQATPFLKGGSTAAGVTTAALTPPPRSRRQATTTTRAGSSRRGGPVAAPSAGARAGSILVESDSPHGKRAKLETVVEEDPAPLSPEMESKPHWQVLVLVHSEEERDAAERVAQVQSLIALPATVISGQHAVVFRIPSRQAAERCVQCAFDAGLFVSMRMARAKYGE